MRPWHTVGTGSIDSHAWIFAQVTVHMNAFGLLDCCVIDLNAHMFLSTYSMTDDCLTACSWPVIIVIHLAKAAVIVYASELDLI